MMQSAGGGKSTVSQGNANYAYNTPGMTDITGTIFNQFSSLHVSPTNAVSYQPLQQHQQPPPYYGSYLAQQPPPSLTAYNPLTNVYSNATASYPSYDPAIQACYSVPSVGAAPVLQGTVSNGTTYYYNPPLGGIVEGSGGGSSASNLYVNKNNNLPSIAFASQHVVVPPSLHSNAAAFPGLAIPQSEKEVTITSFRDTSTSAAAAPAVVVHSSSTSSALKGQKPDQQGSSVSTSNSACVDKFTVNGSGSKNDTELSSNNQGYDGSSRRQQDRRDQNGHAQRGKANFRNPEPFPPPNQGNGQSNPSTFSNSDLARGKRRDNYNNNNRGRGGAVYYNSSVYDDEDRNRGRTAVLAEAAAFMSNLNMGAGTSTTTGEGLSSNESPRRGENSRDRGRYQSGQQNGIKRNPPRLMEGADLRGENVSRFVRGGRQEYAFEARGRGGRKGGGGRGRGGAVGGFQEESTQPQEEQQATGRSNRPNRIGEGGRGRGLGRNDVIEREQRNNRNWNNRNKYPGYGEGQYRETPNNSSSNQSRNGNSYLPVARNESTSPETSEASFSYNTSNTNTKQNPFQGDGRNPLTCRDHRSSKNFTNEQLQRSDDVHSMALKGPSRNLRAGAVKISGNTEEDTKNQRDELTDLLQRGTYECMVCCDRVRPQQAIWSCRLCYNCFHLGCIKKWANSSAKEGESGWRCPGCNNQSAKRPNSYMCFCGKLREPEYNRRDVPHSCGELCGRARESQTWCTHRCNVLCHPGPCPPCLAYIKKWCGCGNTSKDVRCSNGADALLCGAVCGKALSCTRHSCLKTCHEGECGDCETEVQQVCHCGKTKRSVKCESNSHDVLTFECGERCNRLLECGHHHCHQECHVGSCQPCQLTVDRITHCPCGKKSLKDVHTQALSISTKKKAGADASSKSCSLPEKKDFKKSGSKGTGSKVLKDDAVSAVEDVEAGVEQYGSCTKDDACPIERRACTDPVPTCGAVCGKKLRCGKPGSFHSCQNLCHEGPCPTCPLKTSVRCRCGSMDQNVECSKLLTKADEVTCEKQCKKLRFCGRHRCGAKCCIDVDHVCPLRCGKYLSCGNHRCTDTCHRGNCQRCWESSWEELTCHCGASVTFPPVPCGTKPPVCNQLCSRGQLCTHPVSHTCHPEDSCPPCTMLMAAPCFGGHKTMKSTPCYLKAVSCGDLCDKPLACGFHKCNKVCHDGLCVKAAASATQQQKCPQKCTKSRSTCGHPCNQPCHPGKCPNTSCKEKVTVTCKCGQRSSVLSCAENEREYRAMATAKLASQLHHVRNSDDSVDLSHILTAQTTSKERFKRLECNDACHSKERASRLALALQIENPESRSSLGTAATAACYSDFLKDEAKKDPQFGNMVHQALTSLVIKARESKQRNRSHSFAPMSRDKRQFIHEYCKFFGCSSMAYDEEPKKNVVVTAQRGMCLLPMNSVVSVIQRENGHKKVPGPVWGPRRPTSPQLSELRSPSNNGGLRKLEKGGSLEREGDTTPTSAEASSSKPVIDYFDFDE